MYITVRANQVVVGIIFNLLALGLTSYTFRAVLGAQARPQKATMVGTLDIPILSDLPFFGPVIFSHSIFVYITIALVFVSGFVLYRTKFGLKLRAVGEHPRAADTAGINVPQLIPRSNEKSVIGQVCFPTTASVDFQHRIFLQELLARQKTLLNIHAD